MQNFKIHWKALKDKKDKCEPEIPKIMKALLVIKWKEAFKDYLWRCIGVHYIPLVYII